MKVLKRIAIGSAALFGLFVLYGMTISPEDAARHQRQAAVRDKCDQMMADAAPGSEKRLVRELCDQMKAKAAQK